MTDEHREENARIELEKADAALREAQALAGLGMWDGAVSRAYYAAFHAASALLVAEGHQARTHAGTHDLLFSFFVRTGILSRHVSKDLAALQRYREQADYSASIRFDQSTGAEEVERAARVLGAIRGVLAAKGVVR
jgi:hypothetical protein